jgi:hypothetical protein
MRPALNFDQMNVLGLNAYIQVTFNRSAFTYSATSRAESLKRARSPMPKQSRLIVKIHSACERHAACFSFPIRAEAEARALQLALRLTLDYIPLPAQGHSGTKHRTDEIRRCASSPKNSAISRFAVAGFQRAHAEAGARHHEPRSHDSSGITTWRLNIFSQEGVPSDATII